MKRFTKKALPLAVAAAMTPGFASAVEVSGFADIFYIITDDAAVNDNGTPNDPKDDYNEKEGKFTAAGEIDFTASPADGVTVRMDIDLALAGNGGANAGVAGPADSAVLEQAYFAWGATEGVTVIGGLFNNPIGAEAEDAPDINFNSNGVVYNILNHQTDLYGDNVAGLAGAFAAGPATITVAFLNDIGGIAEENSIAFVANMSPMEGLDLEIGYVTQDGGAENVTNFNAVFTGVENLQIGLDYLMADAIVDSAYELFALYSFGQFGVGVRMEEVSYDGADSNSRTTLRASYQVASNLSAAIDFSDGTVDQASLLNGAVDSDDVDGIAKDSSVTLELIATF